MKKLILLLSSIFIMVNGYGQKLPIHLNNDTAAYQYPPLYVINTPDNRSFKTSNPLEIPQVNPSDIKTIDVLKDAKAIEKYGQKARSGVIVIGLKTNINVQINVNESNNLKNILMKYNNSKEDMLLPLYIDSVYIKNPEDVYLNTTHIISIKVDTEKYSNIPFINIITNSRQQIIKSTQNTNPKQTKDSTKVIVYIRGSASQ